MNPMQGPTWGGLAWATLPMLGAMAVLAWRGLGQVRPLAVGSMRLLIQMSLLGLVLGSIFAADSPWLVMAVALIMLAASAYTVSSRQRAHSRTLRLEGFGAPGYARFSYALSDDDLVEGLTRLADLLG